MAPKKKGIGSVPITFMCAFLVIGMVVGAGLLIVFTDFVMPGLGDAETDDTDTTTTTTTTTTPLNYYTFRARWEYVPIQTDLAPAC